MSFPAMTSRLCEPLGPTLDPFRLPHSPEIKAVREERGLQDAVILHVAHFSVLSIDDSLEAKPEVWIACAVFVLVKVVNVAAVAIVRLVWREVPVEPYRETFRLQSPKEAQLAVVANVARVPVLHVLLGFSSQTESSSRHFKARGCL